MDEEILRINANDGDDTPAVNQKNVFEAAPSSELPRIRTYAADMSAVIKKRGESLASIVNKEQTAPKKPIAEKKQRSGSPRKILLIGGAVFLVFVGALTLAAAFWFAPRGGTVAQQEQTLIFANKTYPLEVDGTAPLSTQLADVRANQDLLLGEVLNIVVTQNGVVLSPSALAAALGVPENLSREITGAMVGVHAFDRNQPFIIFTVSAYDRSFAAMLSWEKTMGRTLGVFFAPRGATSGAPTLSFTDVIIRNLDARQSGDSWPILYAFPSQNMLIITTNEFTLKEVLTRLGSSSAQGGN